jgi:2-polyprenyl-3-methyl-5-hydroxy-6-metoxy-1,4-benzoquinol methylase
VKRKRPKLASSATTLHRLALRDAVLSGIDGRIMGTGNVAFPCVPSLASSYADKLAALWASMGRPFSEPELVELRSSLNKLLTLGYEHSPHTLLVVQYEGNPPPKGNLTYSLSLRERTVESYYSEWSQKEEGAWFGLAPDAKVQALARELEPNARVLDVGAGHGRNAVSLARQGLRVDALELVPELCARLREAIDREHLSCSVIEGDILADDLVLQPATYQLVILSEVVSHLRSLDQLDRVLSRLSASLAPGGLLVFNAFLTDDGYTPDTLLREASQVALSSMFTREELASATRNLALLRVSDESALEFERKNLPAEAWPPTKWFESWASGRNVLRGQLEAPPFELRWLVYRKA